MQESAEPRPNVILVVIDALRRDHLGIYGYDKPTSPFMDSLAAKGVVFEQAFSHGSQTFNSTATLFTSRYFPYLLPRPEGLEPIAELPQRVALRHERVPILAEANLTIAEALSAGGYTTLGVFTNPHHHSTSGFWQGFGEARYLKPRRGSLPYGRGGQVHRAFFDWFDNRRPTGPYFAYLHFMDVHNPYRPPKFLRRQFVDAKGRDLFVNGVPPAGRVPTAEDLRFMMGLYDAEIRFVDLVMENLMTDLGQRGGAGETIVIVTSDHGDEFLDHGGLGHGMSLEKEMLHIPLFFHGLQSPSRREATLVRQIDLAPTILDLAGLSIPSDFGGRSLMPVIREAVEQNSEIPASFAWVANLRSLTTPEWHLTVNLDSGEQRLYDNLVDPAGLQNLAAAHPAQIATLTRRIEHLEDQRRASVRRALEIADRELARGGEAVDPEVREQLRALGYSE